MSTEKMLKVTPQTPLTNLREEHAQYPSIAGYGGGRFLAAWQSYHRGPGFTIGQDQLVIAEIREGKLQKRTDIATPGEVLKPSAFIFEGQGYVVFSEAFEGRWQLRLWREEDGEVLTLKEGPALFYPALFTQHGTLHLVWTEVEKGGAKVLAARIADGKLLDENVLSDEQYAYRAHACEAADGRVYVVYDTYEEKKYVVKACLFDRGRVSERRVISSGDLWATQPIVVPCEDGALAAWFAFGRNAELSYASARLRAADGRVESDEQDVFASHVSWYQDFHMGGFGGIPVIAYTWGKYNTHVRVYRKGEWTDPVVMSNRDGHCSVHPAVTLDEKETIHLLWQFAHKNGHLDRNASIVYSTLAKDNYAQYIDLESEHVKDFFTTPIPAHKTWDSHEPEEVKAWLRAHGHEGLLLFGDIHGQSGISDGQGTVDQYFHFAKDHAHLAFTALTDHDSYPDWISQSEWEWIRTMVSLMNVDNELTALLSYEWTPNEYRYDFGHKNVYYPSDEGQIFRSNEYGGMTPDQLFAAIKEYGAQCVPHHPAADWGMVSAATDWDFLDEEVQRLAEIYSRHADFENGETRSIYTKNINKFPDRCLQAALADGVRVGFTAGSDSHQLEHGIEGGIVAAYLPALNRQDVFDAMYERRVYGTSGARILLDFKIGGEMMGSELVYDQDARYKLEIAVKGFGPLKLILLRDNEELKSWTAADGELDVSLEDSLGDAKTAFYYVRVEQEDEHRAWSSPIWIDADN